MYKVVGILCILAGCAGFGNLKVRQEKDRIRHLRAFIHIMRRIQNEISYGKHTVPEICLIIADLLLSHQPFLLLNFSYFHYTL